MRTGVRDDAGVPADAVFVQFIRTLVFSRNQLAASAT